ncbi:M48 family metalloprotease [Lentisalinibacter sediminis]|uniref:M48 family metalloprotease n=1 Tax=Lentisalinibacter sediminis TaxID=2992237 RepID=UPI00386B093D
MRPAAVMARSARPARAGGVGSLAPLWLLATLALLTTGCAVNPVTGEREIRLVSEAQEVALGQQNYLPMRQSQGGDYVLDPALEDYVQQVGQRLAAVSDRPLPYEFHVLNNSVPNAWALPGGKIAINRGLLTELESEAELAAVLGHEIVHAAAGHSADAMERAMVLQGAVLATAVATSDSDYGRLATASASIASQLINQRYSRGAELESDLYGMRYMSRAGYDPQGAVDLQETFVRLNEQRRSDWLSGLFASHPPSTARVEANRQTAAALPPGGEIGAERYREMLATTRNALPAYEAYDAGRKALAEDKRGVALEKANEAIRIEPGEAHFYALRGDVYLLDEKYDRARSEYTLALERNDGFFYYYLKRGLTAERLGDDAEARRDLAASLELLPTAPAYLALGDIERRAGNRAQAVEYYQKASGEQGEVGARAQAALMRLDLSQNPEAYLRSRTGLADDGRLLLQIDNPTRVGVTDVVVAIRYLTGSGSASETRRRISGVLEPGNSMRLDTGLGPFTSPDQYQVRIIEAAVAR